MTTADAVPAPATVSPEKKDLAWLHKFLNCTPFGPPTDDILKAHRIVDCLAARLDEAERCMKVLMESSADNLRRAEQAERHYAELEKALAEAKSCEVCPNQGWYAERDRKTGDPEQVQCEFCYCEPTSIFNVKKRAIAALAAREEKKP